MNPSIDKNINVHFKDKWRNTENIGKSEAEFIALWNAAYPDDPIELSD